MNNYKYSNKPNLKENWGYKTSRCWRNNFIKNDNNTLPFNSKKSPLAVLELLMILFCGTGSGDVNEAYSISLIDGLTNAGFLLILN
jgi:beta-glucosidase